LKHPGKLIVLDIKGKVYAKTASVRRAIGQQVHVLDLRDGADTGSLIPSILRPGLEQIRPPSPAVSAPKSSSTDNPSGTDFGTKSPPEP
jgi:hypothetical protein